MLDQLVDLARKEIFMLAYGVVVIALWWAGEQVFDKLMRR